MADVDFSNAVLELNYPAGCPMNSAFLAFNYTGTFRDINANELNFGGNFSVLTNTPSKVSLLFTGTFISSGTSFYFGTWYGAGTGGLWKVSNISFSADDTYSFIVDIETSGNT